MDDSATAPTDHGAAYDSAQEHKANFDEMYVSPDPRAYCRTLAPLDYQIPQHGADAFIRLLPALDASSPTVLDLCSSYGFIGALLRTTLTNQDVFAHYAGAEQAALSSEELAARDRDWFAGHRRADAPTVIGLDSSVPAADYAQRAGLVDEAFTEDLEDGAPSADLVEAMAQVDLLTTTGGVGYITERTFDALLAAAAQADRVPWVASLVLRMYPYDDIARTLSGYGLVTEKLAGRTFVQRAFVDTDEQQHALELLAGLGLDPTGLEADGHYHAELFVSRPKAAAEQPLSELLG